MNYFFYLRKADMFAQKVIIITFVASSFDKNNKKT